MKNIMLALLSLACAIGMATQVLAHGDAPHSKCKKGYVLNDTHKCVKAGKN
jgi:hypothetical protein